MRCCAAVALATATFAIFISSTLTWKYSIPLSVVFGDNQEELRESFNFGLSKQNSQVFELFPKITEYKPPKDNVFFLAQDICQMMTDGIFAFFNFGETDTSPIFSSLSETFEIPYINWNSRMSDGPKNGPLEINIRPSMHEAVADVIIAKGWRNITFLYDEPEAVANLERINEILLQKRNFTVGADLRRLDMTNIHMFFRTFQAGRPGPQRIIIDISKSWHQRKVVEVVLSVGVAKGRNFHYLFTNYEVQRKMLLKFKNGVTNVTAFRMFNKDKHATYRTFLAEWRNQMALDEIYPEAAFAYDSAFVFAKAFEAVMNASQYKLLKDNFRGGKMYNRDRPGIRCQSDGPILTFEHGQKIFEAAKKVVHKGITGDIEFDRTGQRKGFSLEVLEVAFTSANDAATVSSESTLDWKQGIGFITNDSKVSYGRAKASGSEINSTLVVTTVLSEPFLMRKVAKPGEVLKGNEQFEGYCVDLMEKLFKKIDDAPYIIQVVKDSKYGNPDDNGKWNGMVGELLREEAQVAVAPLTITKARERVVSFSKPFMTLGISIMIKKPDKQEFSVFSFMSPLSTEIWMYIIFAYVGVSIVIFLVSRFSPYEWRVEETSSGFTISNDFSVYNCLWFTLAAFMQQGTDILPRSISGRIASSAWWFFTMIIVSSYTANLAAFLTLEKMQTPIESVDDLAKQTKIKYGIQGGGSTAEFFRDSTVQIYQRMWQYMSSQTPSVFVTTYGDGIKRVRESKGRYAFLLESTANDYASTRKPCDTMKVGQPLNSIGYGVATHFKSELKDKINLAILELQEKGELKKLENRWWFDRGQCEQGTQDSQSASLNLSKVAGIFYILIGGMVVAMIAALIEFLYRSRLEARKNNNTLNSSVRSQFNLTIRGEKDKSNDMAMGSHKYKFSHTFVIGKYFSITKIPRQPK